MHVIRSAHCLVTTRFIVHMCYKNCTCMHGMWLPDLLYIIMCCQDCTLAIETTRFIVHMCYENCTCATRTAHVLQEFTAHVSSCQLFIALSHNATTGTSFMKTLKLSYCNIIAVQRISYLPQICRNVLASAFNTVLILNSAC